MLGFFFILLLLINYINYRFPFCFSLVIASKYCSYSFTVIVAFSVNKQ